MSRSYKHTPVYSDYSRKSTKQAKRRASHKIRRSFNVPNGNAYRKFSDPWDIHDYISYWTKEDATNIYMRFQNLYGDQTLEEYINKVWKKYYFRK